MDGLKIYDIDIARLKNGNYPFQYEISDDFFSLFDYSLLKRGQLVVSLDVLKKDSFIELSFNLHGIVKLICDRSLDLFDHPLNFEERVILKYGDRQEEMAVNVEMIPENTQSINVAKSILDIITLALPMKKLHPRYGQSVEINDELMYSSDLKKSDSEEIDPRWQVLKKLKNN